jgi:hypothetical protein
MPKQISGLSYRTKSRSKNRKRQQSETLRTPFDYKFSSAGASDFNSLNEDPKDKQFNVDSEFDESSKSS